MAPKSMVMIYKEINESKREDNPDICQIEHSVNLGKLESQMDPTRLSLMQVDNIALSRERQLVGNLASHMDD